jgi:hypothetical protein
VAHYTHSKLGNIRIHTNWCQYNSLSLESPNWDKNLSASNMSLWVMQQ